MKLLLGGAVGGLHTMVDEHFGISIVQYMAAGEQDSLSAGLLHLARSKGWHARLNTIGCCANSSRL